MPAPFSFDVDDGQTVVVVVSEVTPDAGCAGYTVTVSGSAAAADHRRRRQPRAYLGHPTAQPGRGQQVPRIRQRSCVMASPRLPLTSTCSAVWIMAPSRAPSTVWISPPERGNRARRCHSAVKRLPVRSTHRAGIVYCADGFDTATRSHPTTLLPTPGRHWLLIPLLRITTALHRVPSTARCLSWVARSGFSNAVWVYDIASNTWSLGTAAPTGPFVLAGYQQVGQFLYVVGGFDPSFVNLTTTLRLDMSSAPGVWETGPAFTPQLADFGLAYDPGTNTLYSLGGDLPNDGNPFNSTAQVNELDVSAWPGGTWNPSPPDLPAPPRQATQAGFFGNGDIWGVGGINGATFQFLNEVWHRNNGGGGGCPSPTPTATPPESNANSHGNDHTTSISYADGHGNDHTTSVSYAYGDSDRFAQTRPTPTPRPRPTPYPRPTP